MVSHDNNWYEKLFDAVFQFVGILDSRGTVVNANQAALALTGLELDDLIGQPLWDIPWKGLSNPSKRQLKRAVEQAIRGDFVRTEFEIHSHHEPIQIFDFTFKPIRDEKMDIGFIIVEGRDISVYKRTSEALLQSNERFEAIFEKAGIGIVIKDTDGHIIDANPAFVEMLGYSLAELRQLDYLSITHPRDRALNRKLFNELQDGRRESYAVVKRYLGKSGAPVWVSINATVVRGRNHKDQFTIVMAENITNQKQIEAELVELRNRLMQGREMERLKLAQDLHDGPLQEVIGISYQLKDLENYLQEAEGHALLESTQKALQKVSRSLRSISSELRPSTLIPFGLQKAIISHCEEFQSTHPNVNVELDLTEDRQELDEQVRIALFRIYQEALNNIIRHAKANNVCVRFHMDGNEASIEIQDDGAGFKPPDHWVELARKGHLGLVGSIERAREAGGNLQVTSAPGKGTLIRAVIPLVKENSNGQ